MTDYLSKLLSEVGLTFTPSTEREIVRYIKERLVYVTFDFDEELYIYSELSYLGKPYKMPGG